MTDYEKGKLDAEIHFVKTFILENSFMPCRYFEQNCFDCKYGEVVDCSMHYAREKLKDLELTKTLEKKRREE